MSLQKDISLSQEMVLALQHSWRIADAASPLTPQKRESAICWLTSEAWCEGSVVVQAYDKMGSCYSLPVLIAQALELPLRARCEWQLTFSTATENQPVEKLSCEFMSSALYVPLE